MARGPALPVHLPSSQDGRELMALAKSEWTRRKMVGMMEIGIPLQLLEQNKWDCEQSVHNPGLDRLQLVRGV